jgi:hypothetical protein
MGNAVTWWKNLTWYWKVPATVLLVFAGVWVALRFFGSTIFPLNTSPGDRHRSGVDLLVKTTETDLEVLEHKADKLRKRKAELKVDSETKRGEHHVVTKKLSDCGDDIDCIDSVLDNERKRRGPR